ncbi:hypothetical protein J1614_010804 [Plenodomus biglobosus]|nr:hypothetical protein J1614_010804 [Plenodomus biglobosus]
MPSSLHLQTLIACFYYLKCWLPGPVQCDFNRRILVSLRSGGHSYARASASIDGGVLLDLSRFSDVTISNDGSSVTVGTGARWSKVNQVLEAKKIAVPGGRNGAVGVGGFTLVGRADLKKSDVDYDDYASGPIVCFCYLQRPRMEIISTFITYTKEPPSGSKWPTCWKKSGFKSIWRYWSTVKRRTLSSACQDLTIGEKKGLSQNIAGTIVKNDKATLEAAYKFYREACTEVKNAKGKSIRFVFVLQPLLPAWMHKGHPNYLGLENTLNELHVQMSFSPVWIDVNHNEKISFARPLRR